MEASGQPSFREVQHLSRWWMAIPAVSIVGVLIAIIAAGGTDAGAWISAAIALAAVGAIEALLLAVRLTIETRPSGLWIRFRPFVTRLIPYDEIATAEARTYRPLREYGGWGIRWGPTGRAYNVRGTRGVQLTLADGKRLMIGSQRPEQLEAAIAAASSGVRRAG